MEALRAARYTLLRSWSRASRESSLACAGRRCPHLSAYSSSCSSSISIQFRICDFKRLLFQKNLVIVDAWHMAPILKKVSSAIAFHPVRQAVLQDLVASHWNSWFHPLSVIYPSTSSNMAKQPQTITLSRCLMVFEHVAGVEMVRSGSSLHPGSCGLQAAEHTENITLIHSFSSSHSTFWQKLPFCLHFLCLERFLSCNPWGYLPFFLLNIFIAF